MYFLDLLNRAEKQLMPGVHMRTFWAEHMTVASIRLEAGAEIPPHSHPEDQAGIVVAGELAFTIGDQTKNIRPGDQYLIPGNTVHSVKVGAVDAQLFEVFSPARENMKY